MGNCSFKGLLTNVAAPIQVMTDSGQILDFNDPKSVSEIVTDFPRHEVFKKGDLLSPLSHHKQLNSDQFYYLFPLGRSPEEKDKAESVRFSRVAEAEPARKSTIKAASGLTEVEPVRTSTSAVALGLVVKNLADRSGFEVLPPPRKGVWKVKLVINTKQLEEILSEEVNTEALIEQMRVAAASSVKAVPRRSRGGWGVKLKPIFCNVLNKAVIDGSTSPKSVTPML